MALFKNIRSNFKNIFSFIGKNKLSDETIEDIEEMLIAADVGVKTAMDIIEKLKLRIKKDKTVSAEDASAVLKEELSSLLGESNGDIAFEKKPHTIIVVGVNGVGKTTTIAKMAKLFKKQGKSVVLAAGDTFRAGAIEQLSLWAERIGVRIVKSEQDSDSASVVYDAYSSAKSKGEDVLIIDTAGRLHNKKYLMSELDKVFRVLRKHDKSLPDDTFLVIDSTTGRNGVEQAKVFNEIANVSGIVLTKLDGTAKGGTIFSIKNVLDAPIKFMTTGEKIDDIEYFDNEKFINGLFS